MLSIAEFACNLENTDDFFNQDCPMKDVEIEAPYLQIPMMSDEEDNVVQVMKANKR
jgi:hypothetical protein